jgi:hypothetical protein
MQESDKTWSESDVDDFKFNLERKKEVLQKLRMPYYTCVIVYVKNKSISDIKKTAYIVHLFSDIDSLVEKIKSYLIKDSKDIKYGLRPESEEEGNWRLDGDLLMQEVIEDYKNSGDKFLYLILDENNNN